MNGGGDDSQLTETDPINLTNYVREVKSRYAIHWETKEGFLTREVVED